MKKFNNQLLTKGLFAVATVAVAGIVGGVNYASAQSVNSGNGSAANGKPTKEQCEATGHKNYGQCVKVWAQDKSGYDRQGH